MKIGIFINGKLHVKVLKVSNNKYIKKMMLCKNIYAVENLTESYVTEPAIGEAKSQLKITTDGANILSNGNFILLAYTGEGNMGRYKHARLVSI